MTFIRAIGYCFRHFNRHYRESARWFCPDECRRCRNFKDFGNLKCSCECDAPCELRNDVPRVNLDYIDAVVADETGTGVLRVRIPIEVPVGVLNELGKKVRDDDASRLDVQDLVVASYPMLPKRYTDFISPYEYSERYLDPYFMDETLSKSEYEDCLRKHRETVSEEYSERYAELVGHCKVPDRDKWIEDRLNNWKSKIKKRYFRRAVRSIASVLYEQTLEKAKSMYGARLKLYSEDCIGHKGSGVIYDVSQNLKIKIFTNFGYGTSAAFWCVLIYKGLVIVPYSMYVNYYYANASDLCRFTRNYIVTADNWHRILDFIAEVVNLESQGEEAFQRRWIRQEVEDMMRGLERIVQDPEAYFDKWAAKSDRRNKSIYKSVCAMNGRECEMYACYKEEMLLDFQAEKVSGAFDFLSSLRKLKSLSECVDRAIDQIVLLGSRMRPRIVSGIERVEKDIKSLEEKKKKKELELTNVMELLEVHGIALKRLMADRLVGVNRKDEKKKIHGEVVAQYKSLNPDYERLLMRPDEISYDVGRIIRDIGNRKRFLARLRSFKERIARDVPEQSLDSWKPLCFEDEDGTLYD